MAKRNSFKGTTRLDKAEADVHIEKKLRERAEQGRMNNGSFAVNSTPTRDDAGRFCKPARRRSSVVKDHKSPVYKGPTYLKEKSHSELAEMLFRVVGQRQWLVVAMRQISPNDYSGRKWSLQPAWISGATKRRPKATLVDGTTFESVKLAVLAEIISDLSQIRNEAGLASAKIVARLMTEKLKQLGVGKAYSGAFGASEPYVHPSSLYREPFRSAWARAKNGSQLDKDSEDTQPAIFRRQSRKWLISRYLAALSDVQELEAAVKKHYGARASRAKLYETVADAA